MGETLCCTTCNPQVQAGIFNERFIPNLATMLSAFIVIGLIVVGLSFAFGRRYKIISLRNQTILTPVPMMMASIVLGIGLGGFVDGIVLHQLLQWHQMLSRQLPPLTLAAKNVNMFWDGVFHAFTLVVTLVGVIMLWRVSLRQYTDRSGRLLASGLALGWGIFNIVEGVIDHHLLHLHNVREVSANPDLWNYAFLGFSFVLLLIGYALMPSRIRVINSSAIT
jgi:uncharacterized membrane protein